MIPRYEKSQISKIWTDEMRAKYYLKVELALIAAYEQKEILPKKVYDSFKEAKINISRINEIEEVVKHDIIAFCSSITEQVNPEMSKFFHFGVTSSDIIDTAQSLQIKDSLNIIIPAFKKLNKDILNLTERTMPIIGVGRSHGMYAEPLSYGQKFLGHYAEFARRLNQLEDFYQNEITGQLSGAVGNYTVVDLETERMALEKLGLKTESISTQVIPRDRLSNLSSILSLTANAIERISIEIRHLHRSEVGEVFEGFSKGQKGSSTMPHKKNPISTENLTGISRVIRSHSLIAMENNMLWHERDISHSSAERLYLPDLMGLSLYAIERLGKTLQNLVIKEDIIEGRSEESQGVLSSYYLHQLILKAPLTREEIYKIVQEAAFHQNEGNKSLSEIINQMLLNKGLDLTVEEVNIKQLKGKYRESADLIKQRVLKDYPLRE